LHGTRFKSLGILASLLALFALGTVGFMVIEGFSFVDALFLTVTTLSTVGYGTLKDLSLAGKLFTVAFIVVGVVIFSYYLTQLLRVFIGKGLLEALSERRMNKKIAELEGHYIVCGHGRIGSIVTGELRQKGTPLVVLESRPEVVAQLEAEGILVMHGDAREEAVLQQAGVGRAKGLIALLPADADNLYLILAARDANPGLNIIARANEPSADRRLQKAGANHVISPHREGGKRIARMILNPHVTDFIEMATGKDDLQLQMEEFVVKPSSPLAGKTLTETGLLRKHKILVVAIKRADGVMTFNPEGPTPIHAGDALIVLGPAIKQFMS
jgi:voltage-gated potassium channel